MLPIAAPPPAGGTSPRSRIFTLPDGRALAFAEWGDPAGHPIFLFHGTPGSRLTRPADEAPARARGVRLITVDRPGYGRSDAQPGRQLLAWPADIAALADALHLATWAVVGVSGGGPHALACTYQLPHRVAAVALVGGVAPLDQAGAQEQMLRVYRLAIRLSNHLPKWPARGPARVGSGLMRRYPHVAIPLLTARLPAVDRAMLTRPAVLNASVETIAEAFRQGIQGVVGDIAVLAHPWGFNPAAIRRPVYLWHGVADRNVPVAHGRYLAATIPACRATFCPAEGHELLYDHWPAILDALLPHCRGPYV
ncbi:MAG TPA: alpha/beta hydrolase [Chloroflexia bacterium]